MALFAISCNRFTAVAHMLPVSEQSGQLASGQIDLTNREK